jgi:flavin reductase (DIM6/NTAB) family NADH-FMN oxidoreductase RutF
MVVTAMRNAGKGPLCGLLVSSFNTVCLEPEVLVSFNIRRLSSTYDAITEEGRFEVSSIWSEDAARAFSSKEVNNYALSGVSSMHNGRSIDELLLHGKRFTMDCAWLRDKSIKAGDHVIMVGRAEKLRTWGGMRKAASQLIYSEGAYRIAGPPGLVCKDPVVDGVRHLSDPSRVAGCHD